MKLLAPLLHGLRQRPCRRCRLRCAAGSIVPRRRHATQEACRDRRRRSRVRKRWPVRRRGRPGAKCLVRTDIEVHLRRPRAPRARRVIDQPGMAGTTRNAAYPLAMARKPRRLFSNGEISIMRCTPVRFANRNMSAESAGMPTAHPRIVRLPLIDWRSTIPAVGRPFPGTGVSGCVRKLTWIWSNESVAMRIRAPSREKST
jgi:hypothetical protein